MISAEADRRNATIADLRAELEARDRRIRELEEELEQARDLSEMAEQFADAMLQQAGATAPQTSGSGQQGGLVAVAEEPDATTGTDAGTTTGTGSSDDAWGDAGFAGSPPAAVTGEARPIVDDVGEELEELDPVALGMLAHYRKYGPATPLDAHVAAGGDGDRTAAYRRNGQLRERDLIAHAGRGQYGYALPTLVREHHDDRLDEEELGQVIRAIEASFVDADAENTPWPDEAAATDD